MMKCGDIKERLPAYVEGELPPGEAGDVKSHLDSCPACSRELEDIEKSMAMVRNLPEVEPPPFFARKIMAQVRAESAPKKGLLERLFFPLHVKLPLEAAAAVLVALIAVQVYRAAGPFSASQGDIPAPAMQEIRPSEPAAPSKPDAPAAGPLAESGKDKLALDESLPFAPPPRAKKAKAERFAAQVTQSETIVGGETVSGMKSKGHVAMDSETSPGPSREPAKTGMLKVVGGATGEGYGYGIGSAGGGGAGRAKAGGSVADTDSLGSADSTAETRGRGDRAETIKRSEAKNLEESKPAPPAPAVAAPAPEQAAGFASAPAGRAEQAYRGRETRGQDRNVPAVVMSLTLKTADSAASLKELRAAVESLASGRVARSDSGGKTVFRFEMKSGNLGTLVEKLKKFGDARAPAAVGEDPDRMLIIELVVASGR
jgi:hypothetical protein